jgi:hypothetical protein
LLNQLWGAFSGQDAKICRARPGDAIDRKVVAWKITLEKSLRLTLSRRLVHNRLFAQAPNEHLLQLDA